MAPLVVRNLATKFLRPYATCSECHMAVSTLYPHGGTRQGLSPRKGLTWVGPAPSGLPWQTSPVLLSSLPQALFVAKMTTWDLTSPVAAIQRAAGANFFSENSNLRILQALLLLSSLPQALFL